MNVRVTTHALAQGRDRGADAATMKSDVAAADAAGRKAKNTPRWASINGRRGVAARDGATGTVRFLWNEDETRAYLCRRINGDGWLVITVLERAAP